MKNLLFLFLFTIIAFSCKNDNKLIIDNIDTVDIKVNNKNNLIKLNFCPHWLPQSQFAGYYAAQDKNIYQKYGIDLIIQTGGPKNSSVNAIENHTTDIASLWLTNAIKLRESGYDIINISQLINRSALMLISKKSSGIKKPQDMNNKKIGVWGGDFKIQPEAFFKKFNLDVTFVPQFESINLFLADGVQVTSAMWYNEYHRIINSGLNPDEINTFFFADYGLNFPEEGIYCFEKEFLNNQQVYINFINATVEGWIYAFNNEDYIINLIMKKMNDVNVPANKSQQSWMLKRMKDLIFPNGIKNNFETLSEDNYNFVCETMKELNIIKHYTDYNSFYIPLK